MESSPNILIFITHDTGRHLGCYGRGPDSTNLNKIAAEGVMFTRAYCTAPQCSPSRASLLTGRCPHTHGLTGLVNRGFQRDESIPTLPDVLGEAGYTTHLFGFQHETRNPETSGYQDIHHLRGKNRCVDVVPMVREFLDSRSKHDKPFFASVGVTETHRQFPRAESCRGEIIVPAYLPDVPDVQQDIMDLNADVERVDDAIGAIWNALQCNKLVENTIFIFTTDHGIAFPGAKSTLFEPGIEISLILHGPKNYADGILGGGKTIDSLVSNMDLLPTILELCGLKDKIPAGLEGKSLLPVLRSETESLHDSLFYELTYHAGYDPMRGIRTGDYKLIKNYESGNRTYYFARNVDGSPSRDYLIENSDYFRDPRPEIFLFNLTNDSDERKNLAGSPDHAQIQDDLLNKLNVWMEETNDPLLAGKVLPQPETFVASDNQFDGNGSRLTSDEYIHSRGWGE